MSTVKSIDEKRAQLRARRQTVRRPGFAGRAQLNRKIRRRVPSTTRGVHLICQYFDCGVSHRQSEYDECLTQNVGHPHVAQVHILLESPQSSRSLDRVMRSMSPESRRKIKKKQLGRQMEYSDAFSYANDHLRGKVAVILNSDIYLGRGVDHVLRLKSELFDNQVMALSRHEPTLCAWQASTATIALSETDSCGCPFFASNDLPCTSHDSFWFVPPVDSSILDGTHHHQNVLGSEHNVIKMFEQNGVTVINPSRTVHTYHKHETELRLWKQKPDGKRQISHPRFHSLIYCTTLARSMTAVRAPIDDDTSFLAFLQQKSFLTQQKRQCVILTYCNAGYVTYTINLLRSLDRVGRLSNIAVICVDADAEEALLAAGYDARTYFNWRYIPRTPTADFQAFSVGSNTHWSHLMAAKMELVFRCLKLNYDVLYTDGDIVWLDDCVDDVVQHASAKHPIVFMNNDASQQRKVCAGFFYAMPDERVLHAFDPRNVTNWRSFENDQAYLHRLIRRDEKFNSVVRMLPVESYPNGKDWIKLGRQNKHSVIHFNWMSGQEKMKTMRDAGAWFDRNDGDVVEHGVVGTSADNYVLARAHVIEAVDVVIRTASDFALVCAESIIDADRPLRVSVPPHLFDAFVAECLPGLSIRIVVSVVDHEHSSRCISVPESATKPGFDECDFFEKVIECPHVIHWYIENWFLQRRHPKVTLRPIGFSWNHVRALFFYESLLSIAKNMPKIESKPLSVLANFQHSKYEKPRSGGPLRERHDVESALRGNSLIHFDKRRPMKECWQIHDAYAFEISPPGNGLDCHRTWEALLLNTIPIVRRSGLDEIHEQFPIVIVDSWAEITHENLLMWRRMFAHQFTPHMKRKLTAKFWMDKMRAH